MREQFIYITAYDSPMTCFLVERVMNDGVEDDFATDGNGAGVALIGKYIVSWDSDGFYASSKFKTADAAREAFDGIDFYVYYERPGGMVAPKSVR